MMKNTHHGAASVNPSPLTKLMAAKSRATVEGSRSKTESTVRTVVMIFFAVDGVVLFSLETG
jgi:hypothetical protein